MASAVSLIFLSVSKMMTLRCVFFHLGLSDFRQQKRPTLSVTLSWFSENAIYKGCRTEH